MTLEYVKFNLFDFQEEEVDRLYEQKSRLIAWEMGTGKTYAGIALDIENRGRSEAKHGEGGRKTLIICPKSALDVWDKHCMELTDKDVYLIDAKNRHKFLKDLQNPNREGYFIIHFEALRLMPEIGHMKFFHIIVDECHRIKNRKAQQTLAVKKIPALYKTAMSGTPADNKPHDLWSVLNWLWPKVYTSYWDFYKAYVESEMSWEGYRKIVGVKNMLYLHDQMRPWYTRKRKKDVLKDLPDKYYTEMWVDLGPQQRKAYDEMQKTMVAWVENLDEGFLSSPLVAAAVISQLVRLQQFAVGYLVPDLNEEGKHKFVWVWPKIADKDERREHKLKYAATPDDPDRPARGGAYKKFLFKMIDPSAKLDALMELIRDNEDEQFIVFSQQKQIMPLLGKRLEKADITHGFYTGGVPQARKDQLVRDFQSGETRVFAGTIASGGVAITLTAASTVVFIDRGWNPGINEQAEDRSHRIGQLNAVQVIDLMAKNTVDIGRKEMLNEKSDWLHQILGDKAASKLEGRLNFKAIKEVRDFLEEDAT
jgi:SNF2 family DNA or RNA helicase